MAVPPRRGPRPVVSGPWTMAGSAHGTCGGPPGGRRMTESRLAPPRPAALLLAAEASIMVGLAAVDATGRQSYVSPAFCAMVGYTRDELLGARAPFAYWPPEERETIERAFAQTIAGAAPPEG